MFFEKISFKISMLGFKGAYMQKKFFVFTLKKQAVVSFKGKRVFDYFIGKIFIFKVLECKRACCFCCFALNDFAVFLEKVFFLGLLCCFSTNDTKEF